MAKFLRPNKVVVVLSGRYAGKKAVIVKNTYRSSLLRLVSLRIRLGPLLEDDRWIIHHLSRILRQALSLP